jgi:hypothetical protein
MGVRIDLIKEIWPAEIVDIYREYARFTPIDDYSLYQVPIANLTAMMFNINRGNQTPKRYGDFVLWKPPEPDIHIDQLFLDGNF